MAILIGDLQVLPRNSCPLESILVVGEGHKASRFSHVNVSASARSSPLLASGAPFSARSGTVYEVVVTPKV